MEFEDNKIVGGDLWMLASVTLSFSIFGIRKYFSRTGDDQLNIYKAKFGDKHRPKVSISRSLLLTTG